MTVGWIIISLFSMLQNQGAEEQWLIQYSTHHWSQYGRDSLLDTDLWRTLFLGVHALPSTICPLLRVDHRMVGRGPLGKQTLLVTHRAGSISLAKWQ